MILKLAREHNDIALEIKPMQLCTQIKLMKMTFISTSEGQPRYPSFCQLELEDPETMHSGLTVFPKSAPQASTLALHQAPKQC